MYRALIGMTLLVVGQAAGYSVTVRTYPTHAQLHWSTPGAHFYAMTPCEIDDLYGEVTVEAAKAGYEPYQYVLTPADDGQIVTFVLQARGDWARVGDSPSYSAYPTYSSDYWYGIPSGWGWAGWCGCAVPTFVFNGAGCALSRCGDGAFRFRDRCGDGSFRWQDRCADSVFRPHERCGDVAFRSTESRRTFYATHGPSDNLAATLRAARYGAPTARLQTPVWSSSADLNARFISRMSAPNTSVGGSDAPRLVVRTSDAAPRTTPRIMPSGSGRAGALLRLDAPRVRPAPGRIGVTPSDMRTITRGPSMGTTVAPRAMLRTTSPRMAPPARTATTFVRSAAPSFRAAPAPARMAPRSMPTPRAAMPLAQPRGGPAMRRGPFR